MAIKFCEEKAIEFLNKQKRWRGFNACAWEKYKFVSDGRYSSWADKMYTC